MNENIKKILQTFKGTKILNKIIIKDLIQYTEQSVIFLGETEKTIKGLKQFAIKIKPFKKEKIGDVHQEIFIQKELSEITGFAALIGYQILEEFFIIITNLFEDNLKNVRKHLYKNRFSLATSIMVGLQLIDRLQALHKMGFVYNNIDLSNIMININNPMQSNSIKLIDLGKVKKYRRSNGDHIQKQYSKDKKDQILYTSLNNDKGIFQSRKDDLESLGYMIIDMINNSLPWDEKNIKDKNQNSLQELIEIKKNTTIQNLCSNLNNQFYDYFFYIQSLGYQQEPDYDFLKSIFRQIIVSEQLQHNFTYDWIKYNCNYNESDITTQNFTTVYTQTINNLEIYDDNSNSSNQNISDNNNKQQQINTLTNFDLINNQNPSYKECKEFFKDNISFKLNQDIKKDLENLNSCENIIIDDEGSIKKHNQMDLQYLTQIRQSNESIDFIQFN